jgi:DNA modification methylase
MNHRKLAHQQGLAVLKSNRREKLARPPRNICAIRPKLYTADGMPQTNQIMQGDSIEILNAGPEGWVDLVFADPPFNIGYLYHNYDDEKDVDEYVEWSEKWMRAVHRALKPTGSFYLAIGDEFAADLCHVARRKIGFHMRNWIIWHYTFGQQTKKMFAKSHTHILYFTKEKPNGGMTNLTFNAEAARAGYFEPGFDTWNESRVCGTFKEREGWHGCQMPIGVLNRIIKASSNPGDVVLDPFNGSGTTVVAAALLGREYVGIDQSPEYVAYAKKRLEHALESAPKGQELAATLSSIVFDPSRESRVLTKTDAFGRARVPRRKAKTA